MDYEGFDTEFVDIGDIVDEELDKIGLPSVYDVDDLNEIYERLKLYRSSFKYNVLSDYFKVYGFDEVNKFIDENKIDKLDEKFIFAVGVYFKIDNDNERKYTFTFSKDNNYTEKIIKGYDITTFSFSVKIDTNDVIREMNKARFFGY